MKKLSVALILVFLGAITLVGVLYWWLRAPVPSETDIVGTYSGAQHGYVERLEIMTGNKFVQTLKKPTGETLSNSGTWKLVNRGLLVDGYSYFIDTETNTVLAEPVPSSSFPFTVYPDMLIWDWDSGFYRLDK